MEKKKFGAPVKSEKHYSIVGNISEDLCIKSQVWKALDKNPLLSPKQLCLFLHKDYRKYRNYVTSLRSRWKHYSKNRQALKRLKFHNWRGWIYALKSLDRAEAVRKGWVKSKAKNKMLVWRDPQKLGRLEWFRTGRINVWVRRPVSKGKALQLLAHAFCWTELISDVHAFEAWAATLSFKGEHLTFDLGERIPYFCIDFLKESNGVVVKGGDASHPTSVELEFCYPDWAERNEQLLKAINQTLMVLNKSLQSPVPERSSADIGVV